MSYQYFTVITNDFHCEVSYKILGWSSEWLVVLCYLVLLVDWQVATLELEDGTRIALYVNPTGFDKLTSTAPCCAWLIKPVQGRKGQDSGNAADGDEGELDSDEEAKDDGCFMTIQYDEYNLTADPIALTASAIFDPPADESHEAQDSVPAFASESAHTQPESMHASLLDWFCLQCFEH